MIDYNLDAAHSILYMQPKSALAEEDFVKIAAAVDPHIEATGGLAGGFTGNPRRRHPPSRSRGGGSSGEN